MTDRERLVVVETKLTEVEKTVNKIDHKLDVLIPTYATQAYVGELKQEVDEKFLELRRDIIDSKRKSVLQVWLTSTLAAVFGAILAILIQSYFSK